MSSPVYFFPGVRKHAVIERGRVRPAFLAERGVAAAFAGITDEQRQTSCYELPGRGPGGHSGLILQVTAGDPLRIGFQPDLQTWHERPAGCDCWVGIDNEHPPTPADLAIGTPRGDELELGDGQLWRVPVVRSPVDDARSAIPFDFAYDGNGMLAILRRECALWDLSEHGWNHYFHRAQYPDISAEILIELCLGALGLNYRVGKVEQTLLRLINSTNWNRCLELLLDVPLLMERFAQEKKAEAPAAPPSSSASPGLAE
jgi:hypothetical protein